MAKQKERNHRFYIFNVLLRRTSDNKDLSPEDYVKIFKRVFDRKIHSESSPSKHCIFRFLFQEKEKGKTIFLSGTLAQFTFIHNDRWFNLNSLDLDEEFKVPDGLFPDAKITDYVFVPDAHRFCYRFHPEFHVSPASIRKFLEFALNEACETNQYVEVIMETDKSSLDQIYRAPELRKLIIDITYSNHDIGEDVKKFVDDDIRASNTRRLKIEATQKKDESIALNESTILRGAIESSLSNGETEAIIKDEQGKVQHIKTSKFPRQESVYGFLSRFNRLAYEKIMQIYRRK